MLRGNAMKKHTPGDFSRLILILFLVLVMGSMSACKAPSSDASSQETMANASQESSNAFQEGNSNPQGSTADSSSAPDPSQEANTQSSQDSSEAQTQEGDCTMPSGNDYGGFKLIGYLPNWYDTSVLNSIPFEQYTHINYAFAIPDKEGRILSLPSSAFVERLMEKAHENNVQVLMSVGGWSYNGIELEPTFVAATETKEECDTLAKNIVETALKYDFDGVDLDWEHPNRNTAVQYESFVLSLREACTENGLWLTCAVVGTEGMTEAITDTAAACFDWINVMCYDGGEGADHSPMSLAENYIYYWTQKRNIPKEQVTLGVPFYERPTWNAYSSIVMADPENAHKDSTELLGTTVFYNGIETMKEKTAFAFENTGGIMIWQIVQDTADKDLSLLNAIRQTIFAKME